MLRIIDEVRPALVFFENVSAWVTDGHFRNVGERLSEMGYRVERPLFVTAASVGAPHGRERVFILAYRDSEPMEGAKVAYACCERRQQNTGSAPCNESPNERRSEVRDHKFAGCGESVADTSGKGLQGLGEEKLSGTPQYDERGAVTELRRALFPPGPSDTEGWQQAIEHRPELNPVRANTDLEYFETVIRRQLRTVVRGRNRSERRRLAKRIAKNIRTRVEASAVSSQSDFRRMAHGLANRADRLRCAGNGVVPLAAAIAFDILLSECITETCYSNAK